MGERQHLPLWMGNMLIELIHQLIFLVPSFESRQDTCAFIEHLTGAFQKNSPGRIRIIDPVLLTKVVPNPAFLTDFFQ